MKTIWTVVRVNYDHFRFENLIFVGDKESCVEFINNKCKGEEVYQYSKDEICTRESIGPYSDNHLWLKQETYHTMKKPSRRFREHSKLEKIKEEYYLKGFYLGRDRVK